VVGGRREKSPVVNALANSAATALCHFRNVRLADAKLAGMRTLAPSRLGRSASRTAARLHWFATSSRGSESWSAVIARDNADRRISSQKSRTGVSHCPNYLGRRGALYRLDKQAAGCVKARVFTWLQIPLWRVGRHDLREVGRQPSNRRRLCAGSIFAQRGSPWPRN
jgi:hypothetical protein